MASRNRMLVVAMGFFLGQLLLAVHSDPIWAAEYSDETLPAVVAEEPEGIRGTAFYYAKRYNGRKTNSGARYNPDKLTAAHPDLPHGTRVKVINLANKKEVVVTINDRCRRRKTPIIDLSRAAAGKLGFLGKGAAKVLIVPLAKEST